MLPCRLSNTNSLNKPLKLWSCKGPFTCTDTVCIRQRRQNIISVGTARVINMIYSEKCTFHLYENRVFSNFIYKYNTCFRLIFLKRLCKFFISLLTMYINIVCLERQVSGTVTMSVAQTSVDINEPSRSSHLS